MAKQSDSVVIFSGGLDSTTLVYFMEEQGFTPHLVSFNYGQRHLKELQYAMQTARRLALPHTIVKIPVMLTSSVLTDHTRDVPEGHYAEDNMKATVVPNRNMMMLSMAGAIVVDNGYRALATGVHAGDHAVYPDCRPEFIHAFDQAFRKANEGFLPDTYETLAPFVNIDKTAIARIAGDLDIPIDETWSCYKGGDIHCGKCGTCVERIEALHKAGTPDPTDYADAKFALEVTR